MTSQEGSQTEEEHEKAMNFSVLPRIGSSVLAVIFGHRAHPSCGRNEREILPWLRLSAELDPQRVETYTVAAYWLRNMGKIAEAEQFCTRAGAPIRTALKSCLNWANSITKASTTQRARAMFGS